jgi:hypothetical protein
VVDKQKEYSLAELLKIYEENRAKSQSEPKQNILPVQNKPIQPKTNESNSKPESPTPTSDEDYRPKFLTLLNQVQLTGQEAKRSKLAKAISLFEIPHQPRADYLQAL